MHCTYAAVMLCRLLAILLPVSIVRMFAIIQSVNTVIKESRFSIIGC